MKQAINAVLDIFENEYGVESIIFKMRQKVKGFLFGINGTNNIIFYYIYNILVYCSEQKITIYLLTITIFWHHKFYCTGWEFYFFGFFLVFFFFLRGELHQSFSFTFIKIQKLFLSPVLFFELDKFLYTYFQFLFSKKDIKKIKWCKSSLLLLF